MMTDPEVKAEIARLTPALEVIDRYSVQPTNTGPTKIRFVRIR